MASLVNEEVKNRIISPNLLFRTVMIFSLWSHNEEVHHCANPAYHVVLPGGFFK
jgi:hypothetical protein